MPAQRPEINRAGLRTGAFSATEANSVTIEIAAATAIARSTASGVATAIATTTAIAQPSPQAVDEKPLRILALTRTLAAAGYRTTAAICC